MFGDYHNPNDYWQHNGYDQYKDMNPDERMAAGCLQGAALFLMLVVGILLCALFGSCKSVEYVTVEKVKHDTTYISKWQRDSIYIHDSTFIKEKGDSILVDAAVTYPARPSRCASQASRVDVVTCSLEEGF